jgi:hypothetical protein
LHGDAAFLLIYPALHRDGVRSTTDPAVDAAPPLARE